MVVALLARAVVYGAFGTLIENVFETAAVYLQRFFVRFTASQTGLRAKVVIRNAACPSHSLRV